MVRRDRDAEAELNLPAGFRFHPTDEELIVDYLCRKVAKQILPVPIIAEVDLYKYDPWLLPEKAMFGQKEWYFFTPRDRKYPNGSRPNRTAGHGYWKATGADKPVTPVGRHKPLGIKKALVFYTGRSPQGVKTNWIMHEYRLADANRSRYRGTLRLDDWVLCRLYNKKSNWEQEMQHNSPREGSSAETADSDLAFVDIQQSPESYVGNHRIHINAHRQLVNMVSQNALPNAQAGGTGESSDWFMDLNLDELHGSFAAATQGGSDTGSYQDYCLPLLPQPKLPSNFGNLPPF